MTLPAVGASTCASGSHVWNGHDRDLDRKRQEERDERQRSEHRLAQERHLRNRVRDAERVRAREEIDSDDRQQHRDASDECVQEELDRRVFPPRAAPDADQEVHRHEADLPEDVEKEEVERDEHAQHPHFEREEEGEVFLRPLVDDPRVDDRQRGQQCGQEDERYADAIDAEEVVDVERLDPRHFLDELHAGYGRIVAGPQDDRENQGRQAEDQRRHLDRRGVTPR